jgi:hypothetical protein
MMPVSKGLVLDPGVLRDRRNSPAREDRLREVVEDGSNVGKLGVSMKALDDAREVWDGLHWSKINRHNSAHD